MSSAIHLLSCCALALVASCCSLPITESELPLDRSFRIDATVDDEPRGRFQFDTGFTVTTIGAVAAERWRLPAAAGRSFEATDAYGIAKSVDRHVRVPGIRVGETRFAPFDAPVIALPPWLDVDAVLGKNAMQPAGWIVDVPGGRLRIVNANNLERRLAELYPGKTWTVVPLQDNGACWSVPVELAGSDGRRTTVQLDLDTGSNGTSLPAEIVAQLALPDGKAERQRQDEAEAEAIRRALEEKGLKVSSVSVTSGTRSTSLWGQSDQPWFLLGSLQVGRATCESLTVHDSGTRSGLLGTDVLARIVWALDGPGARLLVGDP